MASANSSRHEVRVGGDVSESVIVAGSGNQVKIAPPANRAPADSEPADGARQENTATKGGASYSTQNGDINIGKCK
jgi:hypothetical protein